MWAQIWCLCELKFDLTAWALDLSSKSDFSLNSKFKTKWAIGASKIRDWAFVTRVAWCCEFYFCEIYFMLKSFPPFFFYKILSSMFLKMSCYLMMMMMGKNLRFLVANLFISFSLIGCRAGRKKKQSSGCFVEPSRQIHNWSIANI